ncbi:hypothetical protein [uncultured Propionibacterium sp.]|uniref:hypothetical protein n=1 Tax=uncultured Propionibacterium sp. TaxID=218066 RepID=UPI00292F8DAD|nr:hypothetical protein [uncultured Propionibacterium sp.]
MLNNDGFHYAKALTSLYETGQLLEHITPVYLPPYASDTTRPSMFGTRPRTTSQTSSARPPEETFGAFTSYITGRAFDYNFEHLPPHETENDLVS